MKQKVVAEVFFQFSKQTKQMKALFWNEKVFSLGLNDFEKKGVCSFSIKRKKWLELFHCKKSWLFQPKTLIRKVTFCTFTNLTISYFYKTIWTHLIWLWIKLTMCQNSQMAFLIEKFSTNDFFTYYYGKLN
jgi:hypothetical protein